MLLEGLCMNIRTIFAEIGSMAFAIMDKKLQKYFSEINETWIKSKGKPEESLSH